MRNAILSAALCLVLAMPTLAEEHPNAKLIARFYAAFDRHDAATMATCYAADVDFSDEVFPELKGKEASGMWRMLCTQSADLRVVASNIQADDTHGKAHWDAFYTFTATGRKVHNSIDAEFEFKNGLIVKHRDTFDFYAWSKQALGAAGTAFGWTSLLKNKVRRTAAKALAKFLSEHP